MMQELLSRAAFGDLLEVPLQLHIIARPIRRRHTRKTTTPLTAEELEDLGACSGREREREREEREKERERERERKRERERESTVEGQCWSFGAKGRRASRASGLTGLATRPAEFPQQ
jgi:hypothetical protein